MPTTNKISLKEKIGYALDDGAANIAWRVVTKYINGRSYFVIKQFQTSSIS